jgi:hypothetical protein
VSLEGFLMLALLLAATLASPFPTNNPICAQYFPSTCSEAVGEWLPQYATPDTFWDGASHITQPDSFALSTHNGTLVVFTINLQKARVTYDATHRIVFYETGCCSWEEIVLAYQSTLPPKPLVNRDLSRLKTTRGVQLGMTSAAVIGIYGAAKPQFVKGHGRVSVLAYTTWPPRDKLSKTRSECGQFQNFYFRNSRLILIQLGNGC